MSHWLAIILFNYADIMPVQLKNQDILNYKPFKIRAKNKNLQQKY